MLVENPNFDAIGCWVFDCDGVILDSNQVKSDAMRAAAEPYGETVAEALVAHHIEHGGVSRFRKFGFLFESILGRSPEFGEMDSVAERFARASRQGLLRCAEAPGLGKLLSAIPTDIPRLIVSGGFQDELRDIFTERDLLRHFTAVYGSPDSKESILARERKSGQITDPAIFVGDSRYDYEAATNAGMGFVFLHALTEFSDWPDYFSEKPVTICRDLSELADRLKDEPVRRGDAASGYTGKGAEKS